MSYFTTTLPVDTIKSEIEKIASKFEKEICIIHKDDLETKFIVSRDYPLNDHLRGNKLFREVNLSAAQKVQIWKENFQYIGNPDLL
jgi:hypothetical protein